MLNAFTEAILSIGRSTSHKEVYSRMRFRFSKNFNRQSKLNRCLLWQHILVPSRSNLQLYLVW